MVQQRKTLPSRIELYQYRKLHVSAYSAECDLLVTQQWIYHNYMLEINAIDHFMDIDCDLFATDINNIRFD